MSDEAAGQTASQAPSGRGRVSSGDRRYCLPRQQRATWPLPGASGGLGLHQRPGFGARPPLPV